MKSSEVCIKTRSPPTSLPIQGQVTKHTTVKWTIQFRSRLEARSYQLLVLTARINLSANIMEETLLNVSFLSFQVIMDDKIVKSIDLGDTY